MTELPANGTPPQNPRTEVELQRRRSVVPILVVVGVTFVLLVGSAMGAMATCSFMESRPNPAFQFFNACTLFFFGAFVLSVAWLMVSLIIKVFQYFRDSASS